jgi:hypothetical protein
VAQHFVVTLARQFGSMGRPIARTVSKNLGLEYYDRDLVEMTAQRLKLPISTISDAEDGVSPVLFGMSQPLGSGDAATRASVFEAQRHIILDLADRESCIIVGRCADHILAASPNVMRVFIYAPLEARITNCVERLNLTEPAAKRMIAAVDKSREAYHRRYTGYSMSDKEHMHLMLDSSLLGIDGSADALTYLIKKRFH